MVDVLILIAVVSVLVGGLLLPVLWRSRRGPGQTELVQLAAAAGREEAEIWLQALRRAGIRVHLQAVNDSAWVPDSYAYELWVRPADHARAREVLGLDRVSG